MRSVIAAAAIAVLSVACGSSGGLSENASRGEMLVEDVGCTVCHGQEDGIGPSWLGTWLTEREMADGSTVTFDGDYVRESIADPQRMILKGFDPVMPGFSLADSEITDIIAYLEESS